MACRKVRRRLVACLDGELGPSETARIIDHLATCDACAQAHERLLETTPQPPELDLDDARLHQIQLGILERLDAEPEPQPAPARPHSRGLVQDLFTGDVRVPRGLLVLYAAALLGVLGWAAARTAAPSPQPVVAHDVVEDSAPAASELHQPAAYTPRDGWF